MYETLISESIPQINGRKRSSLYGLRENWLIIQRNIMLDFYYASYANGSSGLMKYPSMKNENYQIIDNYVGECLCNTGERMNFLNKTAQTVMEKRD